ncbi:hypothetical protein B0T21DRAFT_386236 [Apiosordaria backusii]|uniref:Uncharacterized protein n=1 Tax=Apiosordaria backusii TaxID=314023 RepID=A0AA40DYN5_9PEZI|nr:hypothetical protein B0T21DRAFT_386236 [Apiosordaria backusii]
MQTTFVLSLLAASASAMVHIPRQGGVNPAVIPQDFGVKAGDGRDTIQVGSCAGANQKPIPCDCPPAPNDPDFLGKLSQGLSQGFFPDPSVPIPISLTEFNDASDTSIETQKRRGTAMIQVLQSLNGPKGSGCPGVAAPNLVKLQQTGQIGAGSVGNAGK